MSIEQEFNELTRQRDELKEENERLLAFERNAKESIEIMRKAHEEALSTATAQLAAELEWTPIESAPRDGKCEKFLVTNNLEARTASGHMSHVWLVNMVHKDGSDYTAFDDFRELSGLTHWMKLRL